VPVGSDGFTVPTSLAESGGVTIAAIDARTIVIRVAVSGAMLMADET
jgi:hypothetical protein